MKLAILLILSGTAFGQVRYDSRVVTVASNVPVGANAPVLAIPNALVTICVDGNCITKAPVFSDAGLSVPAANPQTTNGQGGFGFWASPGTYFKKVVLPSGALVGIYPFTLGGSGGGGGGLTSFTVSNLAPIFTAALGASPLTSPALTFTLSSTSQNFFLAGPTSGTGVPTYRAIVAADIPTSLPAVSIGGNAATATTATSATTATTAANLSGTPALPNGTTATTQTVGDNTAKIATDAFVLANAVSGGGGMSGQTPGYAVEAATATTATGPFPLDDAVTLANYITAHKKMQVVSGGTDPSQFSLVQTGFAPTVVTSAFTLAAPTAVTTPSTVVGFTAPCSGLWTVTNTAGIMPSTCTTAPTGAIVGSTDTQTLTNKIVNGVTLNAGGSATAFLNGTGAYTTPAGSGNTTSTSLTTNSIPKANGANSIINSSLSDNGTTVSTTESLSVGASVATTPDGVHPAYISLVGNTTNPSINANTFGFLGPATTTFTAYAIQFPGTGPAAASLPCLSALSSSVSTVSYCAAPTGTIVGTTDTQTLTNKSISIGQITGTINATQVNGAAVPTSACAVSSNASNQLTALTCTGTGTNVLATSPTLVTPVLGVATATSVNGTTIPASATLTQTIASGTAALGTAAIASGACATVVTATATGTATTDVVSWGFNGDVTAVTGYAPVTTGGLALYVYPTTNTFNTKVCNPTSASITPGAVTLNWRVAR